MSATTRKFPKGFLWGAAISAHQTEGGNRNNWTDWEKANAERLAKRASRNLSGLASWQHISEQASDPANYISANSVDHWNRCAEDYKLAAGIGMNALRVSVEWSRIFPAPNRLDAEALSRYQQMIRSMKSQGLEPFVTLWHTTFPKWAAAMGGWESSEVGERFLDYVRVVVEALPEVNFWLTLNEPEVYSRMSYLRGDWPPNVRNLPTYFRVVNNLAGIHRRAYELIKEIAPGTQVSLAKNNTYFEPLRGRIVNKLFAAPLNYWANHYFLERVANHMDFVGLNFYFHQFINVFAEQRPHCIFSDMGWELCSYGMYFVLRELKRYNLPVYITENGLADLKDELRSGFILDTMHYVHHAMQNDGIDVRGYFHWSLLDNFEWDSGFWPKFGLIGVDRATMRRTVKASADEYARIIRHNGFDSDRDPAHELASLA